MKRDVRWPGDGDETPKRVREKTYIDVKVNTDTWGDGRLMRERRGTGARGNNLRRAIDSTGANELCYGCSIHSVGRERKQKILALLASLESHTKAGTGTSRSRLEHESGRESALICK